MTKTIVITSGKGGVGKTTISVNTALEISRRNFLTCLFDADLGLANVDILLGLQPENTLDDVIFGDKELDEIILHPEIGIEIKMLHQSSTRSGMIPDELNQPLGILRLQRVLPQKKMIATADRLPGYFINSGTETCFWSARGRRVLWLQGKR